MGCLATEMESYSLFANAAYADKKALTLLTVSDSFGCVMVSHYERLFELVPPSHVHILGDGKIVLSGGQELIERIDKEGYRWVKELGFDFETEEDKQPIVLGIL